MDCQDNPKKYEGKKVSFLALVYNPDKLKKGIMVPGRFAMTCCVEDVTFIGFKTKPCTSWSSAVKVSVSGRATYFPRSAASLKCVMRAPVSS